MVAVAVVGAGVIGAAGSAIGGSMAAGGAKQAAQIQAQTEQQMLNMESPFISAGTTAATELSYEQQAGLLGGPAPLDQASIAQMPGYQFTLGQGLLSTQNAQAAQGLGVSGNALAAASQYATGLASTNFQNYFNDYWANQNNRYNMLFGTAQMGANAAALTSGNMITSAANQGSAVASAAAAQGSGIAQGLSSLGGTALLANALTGTQQSGSAINPATGWNTLPATNVPTQPFGGAGSTYS